MYSKYIKLNKKAIFFSSCHEIAKEILLGLALENPWQFILFCAVTCSDKYQVQDNLFCFVL